MQCPKCGYVRKVEDMAPEWQCPACQVVYAKASGSSPASDNHARGMNPYPATAVQAESKLPSLRTIVSIALVVFIAYGGYQFFSGVTITRESSGSGDSASPITASEKTVLLYSSSGCRYCKLAKEFLTAHNIAFEEIDAYNSERGKADFAKLGSAGVPVIIVGDSKIIGFNKDQLKSTLKSKGLWH